MEFWYFWLNLDQFSSFGAATTWLSSSVLLNFYMPTLQNSKGKKVEEIMSIIHIWGMDGDGDSDMNDLLYFFSEYNYLLLMCDFKDNSTALSCIVVFFLIIIGAIM